MARDDDVGCMHLNKKQKKKNKKTETKQKKTQMPDV